jgi:hypothetical protein
MTDESDLGPEVDENITLDTKPVTITVKPLPEENKPLGFNGAVGNFSVEASLNHKSIAADDEATLHVVVKGKGNLPVVAAPVVDWPDGIRAFDPTAKEDVNKTVAPMTGSKSFDYVFTPHAAGHYTIPAVNFPYFDPATQSYKTAGTQPLDIQVTPAVRSHSKTAGNAAKKEAPAPVGMLGLARDHLEWIIVFLLLLGVVGYFWRQNLRLRKGGLEKKVVSTPNRPTALSASHDNSPTNPDNSPAKPAIPRTDSKLPASATPVIPTHTYIPATPAIDPLQEARALFEGGDSKGFYREVNRAIWKAMSRKLDLPASELNKQNSIRQLQLRGWDDTALLTLENLLNECEMNLYTPAYDRWNMQQLLRQAEWVMDRLA